MAGRLIHALPPDEMEAGCSVEEAETCPDFTASAATRCHDSGLTHAVAEAMARLSTIGSGPAASGHVAERSSASTEHPLSHGQRALWFMQRIAPESAAQNLAHAARIPGDLDVPAFRQALARVVERHAALRTTFTLARGEPVQRVHEWLEPESQVVDASGWSDADLRERLTEETCRPFDLERGPLMRSVLFARSPEEHVWLLVRHHLIDDMWSITLFLFEFGEIYSAEKRGETPRLKAPGTTYTEHVRREAERLAGPEGERLWSYWSEKLSGELPVLNLPTDRTRPVTPSEVCGTRVFRLDAELSGALRALGKAHGASSFTTMLAAFQALLHRYTGQEEILVGSTRAGRSRETARTLGYFVNSVVLHGNFAGSPSFSAFLTRMHRTVEEAAAHDGYPFPLLVQRLQPTRDLSRPPLFQVMFSWQKTTRRVNSEGMSALALGEQGGREARCHRVDLGLLPLEPYTLDRQVSPFDLTLLMAEVGEELVGELIYNLDLFDAATIDRMSDHFRALLAAIVAAPEQPIARLPLLTDTEQRRLLADHNDTAAPYPHDCCIHHLFEAHAARQPEAVALACEGELLTYGELDRRANRLARFLIHEGVGPEVLVGIATERSLEMVVGILGVLKAGGAYLPLDPSYPVERLAFMMADSRASLLLTQAHLMTMRPVSEARVIHLDADWAAIERQSDARPDGGAGPESLAYVIYTSGSTGRPKGTLLCHQGLCNLATWQRDALDVNAESRVLQFAPFSFDASVWELVMALANGATLCLASQEVISSAPDLTRLLRKERITHVTMPPSVLSVLPDEALPDLKVVIAAGEACPAELAARWSAGRAFYNAYGPTETTVCASIYRCDPGNQGAPPIGRPIANTRLYVLDANGEPAPEGVPGELYIGGVSLARGYLNRPELTAERFVSCHVARATCRVENDVPNAARETRDAQRLYKTGDLVRWRPDGNVEFLGRIDHQVKIRGFRIETGEVEAALKQHAGVQDAVVVAREDLPGERRLVAYVVPTNDERGPRGDLGSRRDRRESGGAGYESGGAGKTTNDGDQALVVRHLSLVGALRAHLKERLPEYMLPSVFVPLERLPLLPNGKVDRRALPARNGERPDLEVGLITPRNEIEQMIAAIWRETLGVDQVGAQDNFFELGGHSLLAVKVHGMLQETFQRQLSMVELFRYPTVAQLGEYLTRAENGNGSSTHANGNGSSAGSGPGGAPSHSAYQRAGRQKEAALRQQQRGRAASRRRPPRSGNGSE